MLTSNCSVIRLRNSCKQFPARSSNWIFSNQNAQSTSHYVTVKCILSTQLIWVWKVKIKLLSKVINILFREWLLPPFLPPLFHPSLPLTLTTPSPFTEKWPLKSSKGAWGVLQHMLRVFRTQGVQLVASNVVLDLLNKISKLMHMWCYRNLHDNLFY